MQNLLTDLAELLETAPEYLIDGTLNKGLIIDDASKLTPRLLELLLSHKSIRSHFFQQVGDVAVFDKVKFIRFVNTKQFLPDSYTQYKNRIGLATPDGRYLAESREVVLAWPHKDCVLEGGQTKEDVKRDEVFYNETLAPDDIDRLTAPKALGGWRKYDETGLHDVTTLSKADNFILKGNNLLALYSLREVYRGQVKLIYIDPPYNTGSDSFGYNDRFNHASWLTFMKTRLEVARDLLKEDGVIWVNLDDSEVHYAKVLLDEVFGRENFITNVIWQKKFAPQNDAKFFSDNHDHLLVVAKNKLAFQLNLLERTEDSNARYTNPDNDPRGDWTSGDLTVKTYNAAYDYPITTPSGRVVEPADGICWRVSKDKFDELVADNRIWFGARGQNVPRLKRFITEIKDGITPLTIWPHSEVGHNQEARQELNRIGLEEIFTTPKPERLMMRVIQLSTNEGDLVLDYHIGSGTTAAVAHKMNRRYIGIEQMDYIHTITTERLKKVILGDPGGISSTVNWQGGGSFVYAELHQSNEQFVESIQAATSKEALSELWTAMQQSAFLSYRVQPEEINKEAETFASLTLEEQKRFLVEVLDKNLLYVNKSDMADPVHNVPEKDQQLTRAFYGME